LQDVAVGRATDTVQQCKDYLTSAKDASFQQVGAIVLPAGKADAAPTTADAEQLIEPQEEEEQQLFSIDQAVENIERNRFGGSVRFAGFPADAEEDDVDDVMGSASRQVTIM